MTETSNEMVLLPNIFDDFTKEWEGGAIRQSPVTLKVYFHFIVEVERIVVVESLKPQKVTTLERMRQN